MLVEVYCMTTLLSASLKSATLSGLDRYNQLGQIGRDFSR